MDEQKDTNDIDILRKTNSELIEELREIEQDLKETKKTFNVSLAKNETEEVPLENKVKLYELLTGIYVDDISIEYSPIKNEDGKTIDASWFRYKVDARIKNICFHVSYKSNQIIEDAVSENYNKTCDIRELKVTMNKEYHRIELGEALNYFQTNPSKIGMLFCCLRDYNDLFYERRKIAKTLKHQHKDMVNCGLVSDEDDGKELVYMEINVTTKKRSYFELIWTITFDKRSNSVVDNFKVRLLYEEKDFVDSVEHNFSKLCDATFSKTTDGAVALSRKSEKEKLKLLQNAIVAVKAADV